MQAFLQRLGNVRINRRVGLATMTFAAILPVGLSAVGDMNNAGIAALVGVPAVLLGALAWRGNKAANGAKRQKLRVACQKQVVLGAYVALLFSVFQWQWPRDVAILGSVALNRPAFEELSIRLGEKAPSGETSEFYVSQYSASTATLTEVAPNMSCSADFEQPVHIGLVTVVCASVNRNGEICLYDEYTDRKGHYWHRCVYHSDMRR